MPSFGKHLTGARVPHRKHTAACETVRLPVPERVVIPMLQHMGAECAPLCKVGEQVTVGQKIGDSDKFFSVPIHSSVSGTVKSIEDFNHPTGAVCKAVVIETDGLQTVAEGVAPPEVTDFESFLKAVRESGLVGLGGAAFPTHIKLNPKNPDAVDTLIVNAAECEPYITADVRAILEEGETMLAGVRTVMKWLHIDRAIIGIENNKPEAIEWLRPRCTDGIELSVLPAIYPKGGEKVLIYETTGRIVGEGMLPADVGAIVMNVSSLISLETYLRTGMPLVEKRLTVDGGAVAEPKNVRVPLGVSYAKLIEFCGGYTEEPGKVVMGGPMMGIAVYDDEFPVLKNNNAVLALSWKESKTKPEQPCIRCGRCLEACPFDLMPAALDRAQQAGDVEALKRLKVNLCMECGCCAYVCPAGRPLVQSNKLGKKLLRERGGK